MTVEITGNTISGLRSGLYGKRGEKGVRVFDLKGGYVVVLQTELDISSFGVSGRIIRGESLRIIRKGLVPLVFGSVLPTFTVALTLAGCVKPATTSIADMSAEKRWEMREFMISHWSFPKDPAQLEQFAKDGFNTVIAVPEELPDCRKHGFKAILAAPPEKAAAYRDDPLIWGYFVLDEPGRKKIPYTEVASKVAAYHRLDPSRPAYVNLNREDDVPAFISAVKPRLLSYDYYQWWEGQEIFFPLLEKFRTASLETGIPLICWIEAVVVPSGEIPTDNAARIRQSVYCSLAYGVKGIQWWAWRPFNRDAGTINSDLKQLGPALVRLKSVNVFHTPPVPKSTSPVPRDHWVQSPTKNLVLGIFQDKERRDFILVVNREYRRGQKVVLEFATPVLAVEKISKNTGKWVALPLSYEGKHQVAKLDIHPGDGELLHIILQ